MISADPKGDRDLILKGQPLAAAIGDDAFRMPLRGLFLEARDVDITQVVYNYFAAVNEKWPLAWNTRDRGFILNRTNGVRALLRFLRKGYLKVAKPGQVPAKERFSELVFSTITLEDNQFNTDNFLPGTSGEARLVSLFEGREETSGLISWQNPSIPMRDGSDAQATSLV